MDLGSGLREVDPNSVPFVLTPNIVDAEPARPWNLQVAAPARS